MLVFLRDGLQQYLVLQARQIYAAKTPPSPRPPTFDDGVLAVSIQATSKERKETKTKLKTMHAATTHPTSFLTFLLRTKGHIGHEKLLAPTFIRMCIPCYSKSAASQL